MTKSPWLWVLGRWTLWLAGASLLLVGAAAIHRVGWRETQEREDRFKKLEPEIPHLEGTPSFVTSERCQSCHPVQHASWKRTFHRTMTQLPLPENVVGKFDGTTVHSDGLAYRVESEGGRFFAEMPDPDVMMYVVQGGKKLAFDEIPRVRQPVIMATGSHHYQTYWVASPRYDRLLQTLPLVYLIQDKNGFHAKRLSCVRRAPPAA